MPKNKGILSREEALENFIEENNLTEMLAKHMAAQTGKREGGMEVVSVRAYIPGAKIPDGEYIGIHGGYVTVMKLQGYEYEIKTKIGVRGVNIPCTVIVDNGIAEVYLK